MLTAEQELTIQNILADNELTKIKDAAYAALKILEDHPERFSLHRFADVDDVPLKSDDVLWGGNIVPTWADPEPNWEQYDVQPIVAKMSGVGAMLYAYHQDGGTDDWEITDIWNFVGANRKAPEGMSEHEWHVRNLYAVIGACDESLNEEYYQLEEEFEKGEAES
jgi:hypothetical protein